MRREVSALDSDPCPGESRASDQLVWRHWVNMNLVLKETPSCPFCFVEQQGRGLGRNNNSWGGELLPILRRALAPWELEANG